MEQLLVDLVTWKMLRALTRVWPGQRPHWSSMRKEWKVRK